MNSPHTGFTAKGSERGHTFPQSSLVAGAEGFPVAPFSSMCLIPCMFMRLCTTHAGHLLARDENMFSFFEGVRLEGNERGAGGHKGHDRGASGAHSVPHAQQASPALSLLFPPTFFYCSPRQL